MRTLFRCKIVVATLLLIPTFIQAQQVSIKPIPEWITVYKPDLQAKPDAKNAAAYYYLLIDAQDDVQKQSEYRHYAYRLLTNEGIQEMADITVNFDPSFQKLTFHQLVIHRDGKIIDKLTSSGIRTIQREESMDRYLYDGSFSAIVNLQDVRVGDVVEYTYSIRGYNPVFEGHYACKISFDFSVPYEDFKQRIIFPATKEIYTKYNNGEVKPEIKTYGSSVEYNWSLHRVNGITYENNEPDWYDPYRHVLITDFKNWREVSSWAVKQFAIRDTERLALKKKLDELFKGVKQEDILLHAIRFVQDEVRYLGFEAGLNSHKPHAPVQVFDQRFGDCKDKSLLLSTMLNLYNIEAYPMLVNTSLRSHTSERLPSNTVFNHCVVQITHGGKSFFVDPTINNQGGMLTSNYFPPYGQGLVVSEASKDLLALPDPAPSSITEEQTFDVSKVGGEAILTVQTTYKGIEADIQRSEFASKSIDAIQKGYVTFYANQYPDIQVEDTVHMSDNRQENILTIEEKYKVTAFWKPQEADSQKIYCNFYGQTLETYFSVSKSSSRKVPYRITYPLTYEHTIRVNLPETWTITPDNKNIETPYYKYDYYVSYDDNDHVLILQTLYKTKSDHIPVHALTKFIDDHGVMMSNLSYSLLYSTTSTNSVSSADGISWFAIIVSFITLAASAWFALRLYHQFDPEPELPWATGQPIGGWLILVAIGLVFTPLKTLYGLLTTAEFFEQKIWSNLVETESFGLLFVMFIELVYNVMNTIFSALLIVLFFEKRSSLPKLIIIFYCLNLAMVVLDGFIAWSYLTDTNERNDAFKEVFRSLIMTAIWVPYFNTSVRVRETFVERSNTGNAGAMSE
jgi:transglutaminase-like putative cysteine protease